MKLPSPGFLIDAFAQATRRFPATMLSAFTGVIAMYIIIGGHQKTDEWVRTCLICLLGLPLFTGLAAFSESSGWDKKRGWILQLVGIAFLTGYWFLLDIKSDGFEYQVLPGYFTLLLVAHLFVATAPYLNNRPVRDFWEYNKALFANIIIGGSFTLILFAGLSIAILAMDQLFDLDIKEKTYPRLFCLLAGIFNTAYFLFQFPKNYSFSSEGNTYASIFKSLCKFILIPIVGLYFLILYAYSFKIVGAWSLPRGWVGSLVIGFSVVGIFTYLLNYYLPEQDKAAHVQGYRRWFWRVLFPLTILLFVAIGRRMYDYGVTEMRFLVAETGVWIATTCLYFYFSKKDNIKFIPISLGLFALVYGFGPLSGRAVSERSQMGRLVKILEQNGRLEAGKMKPGTTPVTDLEAGQLESAISFLDQRERLNLIEAMMPMPIDSLPDVVGQYGASNRLCSWLGISVPNPGGEAAESHDYYTQRPNLTVGIKGFEYFQSVQLYQSNEIDFDQKGDYFQLSADNKHLEWWKFDGEKDKKNVEVYDLQPMVKTWFDNKDQSSTAQAARIAELNGENGPLRLIVWNSNIQKDSSGYSVIHLDGFVFFNQKK